MLKKLKFLFGSLLFTTIIHSSDLVNLVNNAINTNNAYLSEITQQKSNVANINGIRSYLYPNINFNAGARYIVSSKDKMRGSDSKNSKVYDYGISLTQPIISLEAFNEVATINDKLLQAELALSSKKNELILNVVNLYLDALKTQDALSLMEIQKITLQEQKNLASSRIKVGLAKAIDIQEIESKEANLVYMEMALKNNLQLNLDNLKSTTQVLVQLRPNNGNLEKDLSDVLLLKEPLDAWQDRALSYNFNILQLKLASQLSEKQVASTERSNLPTLDGVVAYNRKVGSIPSDARYAESNFSVGLDLKVNLFAGGRDKTKSKSVKLDKQVAAYNLLEGFESVKNSVSYNYKMLNNLLEQMKSTNTALQYATTNYNAAKKSYSVGVKSNNDVILAIEQTAKVKNDVLSIKYEALKAIIQLYALVGPISEENILLIDSYLY